MAHNGHFVLVSATIYKLLFLVVGMAHSWPYRFVLILFHLACVALVYVLAEKRFGRWVALFPAGLALFPGASSDDLLWGFQIAFVGALAFGLGALVCLDREEQALRHRRRDPGLPLAGQLRGRPRLRDRDPRRADRHPPPRPRLWVALIPFALYGLWFLGFHTSENNLLRPNIRRCRDTTSTAAARASPASATCRSRSASCLLVVTALWLVDQSLDRSAPAAAGAGRDRRGARLLEPGRVGPGPDRRPDGDSLHLPEHDLHPGRGDPLPAAGARGLTRRWASRWRRSSSSPRSTDYAPLYVLRRLPRTRRPRPGDRLQRRGDRRPARRPLGGDGPGPRLPTDERRADRQAAGRVPTPRRRPDGQGRRARIRHADRSRAGSGDARRRAGTALGGSAGHDRPAPPTAPAWSPPPPMRSSRLPVPAGRELLIVRSGPDPEIGLRVRRLSHEFQRTFVPIPKTRSRRATAPESSGSVPDSSGLPWWARIEFHDAVGLCLALATSAGDPVAAEAARVLLAEDQVLRERGAPDRVARRGSRDPPPAGAQPGAVGARARRAPRSPAPGRACRPPSALTPCSTNSHTPPIRGHDRRAAAGHRLQRGAPEGLVHRHVEEDVAAVEQRSRPQPR